VIHTGHWGCGAYGGNKELMALLQIGAAHLAGVDEIVYHTFGINDAVNRAVTKMDKEILTRSELTISDFIDLLVDSNYAWGVSDGN